MRVYRSLFESACDFGDYQSKIIFYVFCLKMVCFCFVLSKRDGNKFTYMYKLLFVFVFVIVLVLVAELSAAAPCGRVFLSNLCSFVNCWPFRSSLW